MASNGEMCERHTTDGPIDAQPSLPVLAMASGVCAVCLALITWQAIGRDWRQQLVPSSVAGRYRELSFADLAKPTTEHTQASNW